MTTASARRVNVPMIAAGVATLLCLGLVAGHGSGWTLPGLDTLERTSVDARFRMRGPRAPKDDQFVVVGIDDATRRAYPDLIQTRRGWARLIDALGRARPRLIALDLFFSSEEILLTPELEREAADVLATLTEPSRARDVLAKIVEETRGDEVLADTIRRVGNVALGIHFGTTGTPQASAPEIPGTEKARVPDSVAAGGDNQPLVATYATVTLPSIGAGARAAGAINILVDPDGVRRRSVLVIQHGDRHYLALGAVMAMAALGRTDASYVGGRGTIEIAGKTVPLGPSGSAMLDFLGPGGAFRHVSAKDVLDGTARDLEDRIVVVGFTYGAYDKAATPFDRLGDGVELHATLAHNIVHDELLRPGGRAGTLGAIAVLGGVLTALQLRRIRRRTWVPAAAAAAVLLGWIVVAYVRFTQGTVVELVAPLVSVGVIALAAGVTALATEGREKARLRSAFSQYVSATIVERILASPELAHLGGERKELTVLFSDIRGFSKLAETLEPEQLAAFLNEYLTPMTEIVLDSEGTLDKYIGDAVMAIWGAPVDVADHAERACAAALAMQERLAALNARWRAAGMPAVAIGVGINTGAMAVGNMGSEARFDYTVLGDAVNLGARLEGLTKEYGVDILVGEGTARAAEGRFVFRELDWVRVKGRGGTAAVYQLLGRKGDPREADLPRWNDALAAYRAGDFDRAVEIWGDLALRDPDDAATATMRARAERLRASPPPEGWDGVYEQLSK